MYTVMDVNGDENYRFERMEILTNLEATVIIR